MLKRYFLTYVKQSRTDELLKYSETICLLQPLTLLVFSGPLLTKRSRPELNRH